MTGEEPLGKDGFLTSTGEVGDTQADLQSIVGASYSISVTTLFRKQNKQKTSLVSSSELILNEYLLNES